MAYTTIDDPSEYFHTQLYTGTGSSQAVTNNANAGNFKPDWLWIKCRSDAASHKIFDSSRLDGSGNPQMVIQSNSTSAENDVGNADFTSIDANGFTVLGANATGASSRTYVAWQWKANGGTTSSNSNGSITSTVQANTTAGFSIVTYVSNNTEGATFGHGLSSAPDLVIVKGRDSADNWAVFNGTSTTNSRSLHLDATDAEIPVSSYNFWNLYWDETRPSSTVVTLGVDAKVNKSGNENFVAYCFHSVQGYSKIGKYIGNGNADGTFVYTGFKPAWLIVKKYIGNARAWVIHDNTQDSINPTANRLDANTNEENQSSGHFDFLSNGFKCRSTEGATNQDTHTFVYMAFAEHPFVSSKGVPVTAR